MSVAVSRSLNWLRLAGGILAIVVGVVAFSWPEATLKVVAFLFGLNLLIAGVVRTVALLMSPGYPVLNRVLGIILGVLTALLGILCMRNVIASLGILLLIVALGWMLDGLAEIFSTVGSGESGGSWRIGLGIVAVLAGIALLVWPSIGLQAFLFFGATVLVFVGICLVFVSIARLRAQPEGAYS
ncbi:HdeD family acid-resistance protein [Paractinoplanes atraurantiacus]|uniref:Uncharacterized membrane protein HdeD, DUF308 family n=1 Tax=Paractinoplanes atraurantiacus TaxID=1036182 RepID=A0A285IYD7_9ACTN|nr:DUF308 domain-containing protein [Actinoplanes atraurantiacus]SNY52992.1 Uncharacterized membrane protein HdeD, DUF308 family [Actinoplanes atraurantiacus]